MFASDINTYTITATKPTKSQHYYQHNNNNNNNNYNNSSKNPKQLKQVSVSSNNNNCITSDCSNSSGSSNSSNSFNFTQQKTCPLQSPLQKHKYLNTNRPLRSNNTINNSKSRNSKKNINFNKKNYMSQQQEQQQQHKFINTNNNNNSKNNNNNLVKNQNTGNNNSTTYNTNYNPKIYVAEHSCSNINEDISVLHRSYQNQQQAQYQTGGAKSYLNIPVGAATTVTNSSTASTIPSTTAIKNSPLSISNIPNNTNNINNISNNVKITINNTNNNNNIDVTKLNKCTSCWSNLTKLQTLPQVKSGETSLKKNDLQEIVIKAKNNNNTNKSNNTNTAPNKRKTYWKSINNLSSLGALSSDDNNKKKPSYIHTLQQRHQLSCGAADIDKKSFTSKSIDILNTAADITNINKTTATQNYHQISCKILAATTAPTAMTTALATVATETTSENANSAAVTATAAPVTTKSTGKATNDITSTATTISHTAVVASTAITTTTTTAKVVTVSATSSSSSAPNSPNSYSLDFLHSVGVKMTGGGNISTLKSNMSNMRTYNNQSVKALPPRSSYNSYSNVVVGHRQHRYMTATGGSAGVGGGGQQSGHHNQQHHNHLHQQHQHHHHQPQQLTIASFMQKDLTENIAGGNNSSSNHNNTNNSNYESQPHTQQQHRYSNYFQQQHNHQQSQHYHQPLHYSTLQHAYNAVGENASRIVGNGSGNNRQQSYHSYNSGSGGPRHQNNINRQQQLQYHHNYHHAQTLQPQLQFQQQQQQTKKSNYASSSISSCSMSSSSSASSISSKTSGPSSTNHKRNHSNKKSSSNSNSAIETLPTKTNRAQHRQQHQHHQHMTHIHQQHSSLTTVTTPQHQNFYNLTYVTTDALTLPQTSTAVNNISTTRSYSPSTIVDSPPPSLLLNLNHNTNYNTSRSQNQQLHFSQHHYLNNQKIMLPPLSISVSSPTASPTAPQQSAIICCSSVNEATTTAAATSAAVATHTISSNESIPLITATNSPTNTPAVIAGNDCDSDTSDSLQSTTQQQKMFQQRHKLKSLSLSSSSSMSSTTSISSAQEQIASQATQLLQSPIDLSYSFSLHPQQQFHQQQFSNHYPQMSPQSSHCHNGVISLLNLPTTIIPAPSGKNYNVDDEVTSFNHNSVLHLHPPHSHQAHQQQLYFSSGEQGTAVAVSTGGYWTSSPNSLPHSNFLYSSTPSNLLTSQSCSTSSTPLMSPPPSEHDEVQQQPQELNQSTLPITQINRSQFSSSVTSLQRNSQINTAGGGSVLRMRGRSQQQQAPQQQIQPQHSYPLHNLLYNNPQHMRSSSTSSSHDFFYHTPPDRFLARAHLIEAKETPSALLNNSKWDVLSQDIWNKFTSFQQTEETFKQKMRLWRYLYIIIKNSHPRYGLYLVGSTISGFGADSSDVDMCLVARSEPFMDPRTDALMNLLIIRDCLSRASGEFEDITLIEAKVPILRFRDRIHQLEVDLNFNNCVGIKNTHLLYCYSQLDWRLRPLVLVTKLWAQYHNINNAKNMTISSYSLVLMVIHFLQYAVTPAVLPCLHDMFPDKFQLLRSNDFGYVDMNESIGPYESKNTQTIGELFLNFLEYYSTFDYSQHAISIRTGGLMAISICRKAKSLKNDCHQWKELCIEEPFDLTNTARSVYDFETFERVKAIFVTSWQILQETLNLNSVFCPITISPHASLIKSTLIEPSTISAKGTNTVTGSELPMDTLSSEHISDKLEEHNIENDRIIKNNKSSNGNNRNSCNNVRLSNLTSLIS